MLALLSRAPRTRTRHPAQTHHLFLEQLEDRLSPATVGTTTPTESLTLNATYQQNKQVTLSGQLTGSTGAIANETIYLTGATTGSATTNSQGNYSVTLTASSLGSVYAASADGNSNTAQYTLVGGNPTISNFQAISEGSGLWYFSGNVSNAPTQGEIVEFGGINALEGQSVTVNSDGTFDFWAIVKSGQGGWATAEAVDWWGDTSQIAGAMVNC